MCDVVVGTKGSPDITLKTYPSYKNLHVIYYTSCFSSTEVLFFAHARLFSPMEPDESHFWSSCIHRSSNKQECIGLLLKQIYFTATTRETESERDVAFAATATGIHSPDLKRNDADDDDGREPDST